MGAPVGGDGFEVAANCRLDILLGIAKSDLFTAYFH